MPSKTNDSDLRERLPERLSPSRIQDFIQCPRLFYYKTICKLRTPNTEATTKGTLAHYAFEHIFDHPRNERTAENAVPYVRQHWEEIREEESYAPVIAMGEEAVEAMLIETERMVRAWFDIETPANFDPEGRERWVRGELHEFGLHGIIDRLDKVVVGEEARYYVSDYKGLALDTPLPTPDGWAVMADVGVGDRVFGADGKSYSVTAKSGIHNRPCYEIEFDDGTSIVCDNVHLWEIATAGQGGSDAWSRETLNADDLYQRWCKGDEALVIPNAKPLECEEAELPIEPYLFGRWLGGGMAETGALYASTRDEPHFAEYLSSHDCKCVPVEYLRGSYEQRISLLRGLMDAAGSWDASRSQAAFSSDSRLLIDAVQELVCGLGAKACVFGVPGIGENHPQEWCVLFTPSGFGLNLASERAEEIKEQSSESGRREIRSMAVVESVPTQCIQVDSPDSLYLAGRSMVPTHNTGKVPSERYASKAFFAMNIYATLLHQELGIVAHELRLVYVKNGERADVLRQPVDIGTIERTKAHVGSVLKDIESCAKKGEFKTKTGPLCNWCDFQDMCPAFHPELDGLDLEESVELFESSKL